MASNYKDNMEFEAEVRRIAEVIWSLEPGECQPSHYSDNPVVKELDGLARLRDCTHLLMVTTSTKFDKIKGDVKKLAAAEVIEKKTNPTISKWLITQRQLDAEHIDYARRNNVQSLTFEQFQRRFFDGRMYLSKRSVAAFGSARDPHTDSITIGDDTYVPLPMRIVHTNINQLKKQISKTPPIDIQGIASQILDGNTVILVAPFGSGKSLTTREIFKELGARHRKDPSIKAPITLNLREHWGQDYCDEMLERHARSIGYTPREDLVIAWRAGMTDLLLDGFDEVASQTVIRTDDKNFMKDARKKALQGVRDFTSKTPMGTGLFICGRDHYFDTFQELTYTLGIGQKNHIIVQLDEFTEAGVDEFLKRNGISHQLPDWLPRKPLILAYLAGKDLIQEIISIDSSQGFGYAWDTFLDRICQREASLEKSAIDPVTLRNVMERLANIVRSKSSGTGPITGSDLSEAYNLETGQAAGEGVLAHLQRLPGLTQRDSDPGSRSFVDEDMLAALQGSAFARMILSEDSSTRSNPISEISEKAISMASYILQRQKTLPETLITVSDRISRSRNNDKGASQVIADCSMIAIHMASIQEQSSIDFRGLTIDSASLGRINLEDIEISDLEIRNSTIKEIVLPASINEPKIKFYNCLITKVSGVSNKSALPAENFSACEIGEFDDVSTNNAVMKLSISPQLKALLSILRKLYKQAGAGRKISALSRGITNTEVAQYIQPVLGILEAHKFVTIFNKVVHPVRKQASRVEVILSAPAFNNDLLVEDVKKL
ncbi:MULTISPECIES: NACHT domain-containing NTPase [unclassified Pseudomonas]|uniref:NACHT domain-containing protein n=1 Tax=unclassified Pseudomonas TaxID=196821 RepID=UPI00111C44BC|nr:MULTISPECIES: hypothetical protein [unclassified Pseudomonas]